MDMLNHRVGNVSTAIVDQNKNGSYGCYAKKAIQAGEEVHMAAFLGALRHVQRPRNVTPFQTPLRQPRCTWLLKLSFHDSSEVPEMAIWIETRQMMPCRSPRHIRR